MSKMLKKVDERNEGTNQIVWARVKTTTQEQRMHQRDSAMHEGKTNNKSSENIRLINSRTHSKIKFFSQARAYYISCNENRCNKHFLHWF